MLKLNVNSQEMLKLNVNSQRILKLNVNSQGTSLPKRRISASCKIPNYRK
jgi:hypothetical protein